MRVLLCDEHLLLVESIGAVFEARGHTVEAALSARQAARGLADHGTDVCVMGLTFGKDNVDNPVAVVRGAAPVTPIVLFTAGTDRDALERARAAGADAWVSKEDSLAELVHVVERVARDRHAGASTWDERPAAHLVACQSQHFLTARELQALEGLVLGKNTSELAQWMGVRESTASTHIQTVLTKLGVHSRLEAVACAVAERLVPAALSRA